MATGYFPSTHHFLCQYKKDTQLISSTFPLQRKQRAFVFCTGLSIFFCCRVKRERGIFSEVALHWEILDPNTQHRITDGQDFDSSTGFTVFRDLQGVTSLDIVPKVDREPEFTETFIVRLYNVSSTVHFFLCFSQTFLSRVLKNVWLFQ